MSAATALVRSLKAEVRKTVGLPGAWLGAALAIVLPLLIEYYTDHDLAARLAAGDPDAPARLGDVGVIGLYVGTAGIVVLVILAPQLAVFLGDAARWLPGQAAQIWLARTYRERTSRLPDSSSWPGRRPPRWPASSGWCGRMREDRDATSTSRPPPLSLAE